MTTSPVGVEREADWFPWVRCATHGYLFIIFNPIRGYAMERNNGTNAKRSVTCEMPRSVTCAMPRAAICVMPRTVMCCAALHRLF